MLALETQDRGVFDLVLNALGAIDRYKEERDLGLLKGALADLTAASRRDKSYLLASYYLAVVEDLLGDNQAAVARLETLLPAVKTSFPFLLNEMRFNLAIAQYHGYGHDWLRAANATLDQVLADTSGWIGRFRYYRLRLHARALRAQVYAMWSIPRRPEDVANDVAEPVRITECYMEARREAYRVLLSPMLLLLRFRDPARAREIRAIAHNALGMAIMYYTDFFLDRPRKLARLRGALKHLDTSETLFPRDWANYCDIGSCHMRLGHWGNVASEFDEARRYLTTVIGELRPNYGFARYEIGRSYRIEGRFVDAMRALSLASQVPEPDRNVSDRRLNREIRLAALQHTLYP
jgi:hypothetical protein